MINKRAR